MLWSNNDKSFTINYSERVYSKGLLFLAENKLLFGVCSYFVFVLVVVKVVIKHQLEYLICAFIESLFICLESSLMLAYQSLDSMV